MSRRIIDTPYKGRSAQLFQLVSKCRRGANSRCTRRPPFADKHARARTHTYGISRGPAGHSQREASRSAALALAEGDISLIAATSERHERASARSASRFDRPSAARRDVSVSLNAKFGRPAKRRRTAKLLLHGDQQCRHTTPETRGSTRC